MKARPYYPEFEAGNLLRVRSSHEDMPRVMSETEKEFAIRDRQIALHQEQETRKYFARKRWQDYLETMKQRKLREIS
tara:strand:+ start:169 stop:399 length:231 start_codon:yes stop_codon:yes gene_type:complete